MFSFSDPTPFTPNLIKLNLNVMMNIDLFIFLVIKFRIFVHVLYI